MFFMDENFNEKLKIQKKIPKNTFQDENTPNN